MVDFDQRVEFKRNELCIIGAGPAGLSAAAHCAELSIPYVLLEAADHASNTIYKYQKGKHVMAEPQILPLRSTLSFAAGKRETVLDTWNTEIAKLRVDIRYGQEVVAIVALVDGASVDAQELIDHAAGSIARYKLPKAVVFRPVIERSPAGKADYRWAREQAVSGDA